MVREAKEETGITDLKFIDGFREEVEYFFRREGQVVHKEVVLFLAETATKEAKLSYEHIGSGWFPYDDALKKVTYDNAKKVLSKAESFLSELLI